MKLFSRKKSNPQIPEPPSISRPRAQGHLPPTSGPRPSSTSRRSLTGGPSEPTIMTPLYARFARADSIENLDLNLRVSADSRTPSFAPSAPEPENDAQRLGYDRPWVRERQASLDAPKAQLEPPKSAPAFDTPKPASFGAAAPVPIPADRARSPLAAGTAPTLRMVPNPPPGTATPDRKSMASRRLSIDAVIAADPFMASKMQSVLRRAPSNAMPNDAPALPDKATPAFKTQPFVPVPSRSSTALPPPVAGTSRPLPTTRVPSAPPAPASVPSRSVSISTSTSRAPPVPHSYRPSLDGASDDGHSTFSHSQSGHQTQIRPVYPSAQPNPNAKRERGPPPVAGTPSPYAWRSGQSDDGHGGSNFYTGGSQTQSQPGAGLPSLPPGAQPPQPGGHQPRKRAPSNPPVSRVPYPAPTNGANGVNGANGGTRRVSVDDATRGINNGRMSGGPGTWGGVAPGPAPTPAPGPTPPYGPTTNPPPSSPGSIPNGAARLVSPTAPIQISGPGFDPYQSQSQQRLHQPARVSSVEPGQIFHHPQIHPQPQAQVNNPPVPQNQTVTRGALVGPPAPAPVQNRLQNGVRNLPAIGAGMDQGRTLSATTRVGPQPTLNPGQNQGGRQSPAKGRQSPAKEGRQSPIKTSVDGGRESPFKANANVNGRQSPSKPDMAGAGRLSLSKPDGRQSPSKPSPFSPTPQKSTLSVDTTTGSTRTPSTLTPGSGVSALRTPVSANTSIATNAPSTSNTLSTPVVASPARATLATSPARTTLSTSPVQTTLSPSPVRTAPSPGSTRALPPTSPVRSTISSGPFQPPNRAPSSESASSYGTAMPLESEYAFDTGAAPGPSRLALSGGGLPPINTNTNTPTASAYGLPSTPRDRLPASKATSEMSTPTSAMMTARMTPTTPSRATISSPPVSARASSPITIPSESGAPELSDSESMHSKKRNLLVKTRRLGGASSFRGNEHEGEKDVRKAGTSAGLEIVEDPFARAPLTVVKNIKKATMPLTPDATPDPNTNEDGDTTPRRGLPLSPPLSSDDHQQNHPGAGLGLGVQKGPETALMSPALTDNDAEVPPVEEIADMSDGEAEMEPESTTPLGSPPLPKVYPLAVHLETPSLLGALLHELSFRDWNALNSLNAGIRRRFEETRALREEVLEFWLRGVGYARWTSPRREMLVLSLRDLNAYMRGVSIAVYRYSAIAESFLAVRSQQERTGERIPGAASKGNLVRALASSCRAYTKVILRLRDQVEAMGAGSDGEFRSPLFRVGYAPLLRVFVPSKEGAWLSDPSVLDCEKELKRAGALGSLRVGDVVWDSAVGDEGNAGRMVWDGNYLVDLDYTYSTTGELPKYIHSFAFSPSYWHKVIRTSNSPLCHIDLAPYAVEIAQNLQLVQDRVQTETPQGGRHTVVRWVHRSRFRPRPGMPVPNTNPPAVVDRTWDGVVVVEVEGTNEGLADLQARCGPEVRLFPAKTAGMKIDRVGKGLGKTPFRLLRASSRPGEIWIRAVREKERLV